MHEYVCNWCGKTRYSDSGKTIGWIWGKHHGIYCSRRCITKAGDTPSNCFITTATVHSRNLPDDCHELTALRAFRDTFMKKNDAMKAEVEEYYEIAPIICKNIDDEENSSEIYEWVYQRWIKDAVTACDCGDNQKAHDIYKEMVLELKEKYY